jgi:hypothetical protein
MRIILFQLHYNKLCCDTFLKIPVRTLDERLSIVFCASYNEATSTEPLLIT